MPALESARDILQDAGVAQEDPGDEIGPVAAGSSSMGLLFHGIDGYRWELYVLVNSRKIMEGVSYAGRTVPRLMPEVPKVLAAWSNFYVITDVADLYWYPQRLGHRHIRRPSVTAQGERASVG